MMYPVTPASPNSVLSAQMSAERAAVRAGSVGGSTRIDPTRPETLGALLALNRHHGDVLFAQLEGRDQASIFGTPGGRGSGTFITEDQASRLVPSQTGSAYFDSLVKGFLERDSAERQVAGAPVVGITPGAAAVAGDEPAPQAPASPRIVPLAFGSVLALALLL
jgi:hypothetical protein